ncbi:hypothetical protein [Undibacter mobilis]|uniref:Uncharacterized protein n=1 Tax=Undibacter mobilis TaxID=2292256 RepID=A0A371B6Q7_9BRAD|nr:hypothetical protein [Undibacter mobilis]RDV03285.1 hypothetical protein DXH78_00990 [Undibacter mobilis]
MSLTPVETVRSPLKRFVQWWRGFAAMPLASEVGGVEANKIASEIGVSVPELEAVRHKGAAAAYPMYRRLASLGLDEERIARDEPGVLNDLQRVCSLCADKKQCLHELKADPNDPHWQDYCPNMPTFEALEAEKQGKSKD